MFILLILLALFLALACPPVGVPILVILLAGRQINWLRHYRASKHVQARLRQAEIESWSTWKR